MRDSIGSAGSVLLASVWADESEEEEDEGEEIVVEMMVLFCLSKRTPLLNGLGFSGTSY